VGPSFVTIVTTLFLCTIMEQIPTMRLEASVAR